MNQFLKEFLEGLPEKYFHELLIGEIPEGILEWTSGRLVKESPQWAFAVIVEGTHAGVPEGILRGISEGNIAGIPEGLRPSKNKRRKS